MRARRDSGGHRWFEELAVSHVLGGLDESEGRIFRAHLLECADCRARVGELRAIAHDLADAERDERRVRAAKAVETKRRHDDEPEAVETTVSPRASRMAMIAGFALLLLLAGWNFQLKGNETTLRRSLTDAQQISEILQFGQPATVTARAPGVDGEVKVEGTNAGFVVRGLDDEASYGLYVLDGGGQARFRRQVTATNGRLFGMHELPYEAHRVILARLDGGLPDQPPPGEPIMDALLPNAG